MKRRPTTTPLKFLEPSGELQPIVFEKAELFIMAGRPTRSAQLSCPLCEAGIPTVQDRLIARAKKALDADRAYSSLARLYGPV